MVHGGYVTHKLYIPKSLWYEKNGEYKKRVREAIAKRYWDDRIVCHTFTKLCEWQPSNLLKEEEREKGRGVTKEGYLVLH